MTDATPKTQSEKSQAESIWLVKSGDRILGPYYESALVEKLYAREIVVIDEVSRPGGRWRYLREEVSFKMAVEELWRRNQGLREDTDIATLSNTEPTSLTATPTQSVLESLIKPPADSSTSSYSPAPPRAADIVRPAEFDRPMNSDVVRSSASPRPKETSNWILWVAALFAISIAAFVLTRPRPVATTSSASAKTPAFDQLSAQALRAERTGRFAEALRLLREAHQIRAQDAGVNLRLANLMVKVERQTVDAKRLANETLAVVQTAGQREAGQIVLGLAALGDHDAQEAQKQFSGALAANPASAAAQFDLGMTAYEQKKWPEAVANFSKCLHDETTRLLASFMLARSQLESGAQADAEQGFKAILGGGVNQPLRQESQLLLAGLKKGSDHTLDDILKLDPFISDETLFSPLLSTDGIDWKSLQGTCESLKTVEGAASAALQSLCQLKEDRKSEAQKTMADAIAKDPSNPILQMMNATLLLDFGKDEEAKGALKMALRENSEPIVLNLMARACGESQDAICEREHWRKLLEREPVSVVAYTGLAKLEYQAGSEPEAKAWLDKAWRLSSTYIPLLQLQDELEQRKQ